MPKNTSLQKYRGLFFSIGIVLALFAVWQVLSWKTFVTDSALEDKVRLRPLNTDPQLPPQIKPQAPEPPKNKRPRKDKDLLKSFEISLIDEMTNDLTDYEELESTLDEFDPSEIWETPTDTSTFKELWELDRLPVFEGCEHLNGGERDLCLKNGIREFVAKNYNPRAISQFNNQPVDLKIFVSFTILENGKVGEIKVLNSQTFKQEQEAIRVISKLPKFEPAMFRGRAVKTTLKLPIHLKSN